MAQRMPQRAIWRGSKTKFEGIPYKEEAIIYPVSRSWEFDSTAVLKLLKTNDNGSIEFISGDSYYLKDFREIYIDVKLQLIDFVQCKVSIDVGFNEYRYEDIIGEIETNATFTIGNETQKFVVGADGTFIVDDFGKNIEKYYFGGKLIIFMEGSLMFTAKMPLNVVQFGAPNSLCEKLFMREDKDFDLKVGNDTVMVHKVILEAASDHFVGLDSPHAIDGYGLQVVQGAVKAMYRLCINDVSIEDKCALLKFFDDFHMPEQKEILEQHLIGILATFNVTKLANCSIDANAIKLQEACSEYLCSCFNAHAVAECDQLKLEVYHKFMKFNLCGKK